jgi:hypothetical protein
MKRIALSQGAYAVVDDCDYAFLSRWKWTLWKTAGRTYAYRKTPRSTGQKSIYMHAVVAARKGLPTQRVDHVDNDGLNNRRRNLRPSTQSQNGMNRDRPRHNTTGYKGVSLTTNSNRFRARITVNGQGRQIGVFDTALEAAYAYDGEALSLHGSFARLNFPATAT